MRVNRESLLSAMTSVGPGLTQKELLQQSSCVVFKDGKICTFNEEIACTAPSPLGNFTGAIVAKPLNELLSKLNEVELDISSSPDGKEFYINGASTPDKDAKDGRKSKRRAKFAMEAQVLLPIDSIDQPDESAWQNLDPAFSNAVPMVAACASTNSKEFLYSCIHFRGGVGGGESRGYIEACDRLQIGRHRLDLPLVTQDVLVRATSLAQIASVGVNQIAETASWLHFRNEKGVVLSCRKYIDNYQDLDRFVERTGASKLSLPGEIENILSRAGIFSAAASIGSFVIVNLRPGKPYGSMMITGEGPFGRYDEQQDVAYEGPATKFLISPHLLSELAKKSTDCWVVTGKMFFDSSDFYYFTCTNSPDQLKPIETKTENNAA